MDESWVCRNYKSGDEQQIITLYQEVNKREMSSGYWRWRYIENPFGEGIIKLMFDEEKLIGHYAVIPMDVQIQNQLVKAVFSMNTITHPDYGRQGIFTYLAEETYKEAKRRGFKFVYGFPNKNSHYGFTRKLEWRTFGKISILSKELEGRSMGKLGNHDIDQIKRFDDRVDSLWGKVKQDYRVIVPRGKEFLNWRFTEHPTVKYSNFIIRDNDNEVLGYIVLKIYTKGDEIKGHIVDMLSIKNEDIVKALLKHSYNYLIEKSIRNISCWIPDNCFYADILKQEGFVRREIETYFCVRIFDKQDNLLQNVEYVDKWHFTMGDSDIF